MLKKTLFYKGKNSKPSNFLNQGTDKKISIKDRKAKDMLEMKFRTKHPSLSIITEAEGKRMERMVSSDVKHISSQFDAFGEDILSNFL